MPTDISKYALNHTMLRIKDPEASIKFYTEVLGMKYITKADINELKFSLYFVAFVDSVPEDEQEKKKLAFSLPGVLELTHIWGTEKEEGNVYSSGNEEVGKGYGHVALLVDDLKDACERFKQLGVKFAKELKEGPIHSFAFITDPDGYWIEVIENPKITGRTPV